MSSKSEVRKELLDYSDKIEDPAATTDQQACRDTS